MKKNEEPFQMKGKGMAAAIAICFIAVVALVGAYTFSSYKREMKEPVSYTHLHLSNILLGF